MLPSIIANVLSQSSQSQQSAFPAPVKTSSHYITTATSQYNANLMYRAGAYSYFVIAKNLDILRTLSLDVRCIVTWFQLCS